MSVAGKQELMKVTRCRYKRSTRKEKTKILDEFVEATGLNRKYAITSLGGGEFTVSSRPGGGRPRYGKEVIEALETMWEASNRLCSKRLVAVMPRLVEAMERGGHVTLNADLRDDLLAVSAATVDRLLASIRRRQCARGRGTTRTGNLMKKQIRVRTFADWEDGRLGFFEIDLVAHCGTRTDGQFVNTLVATDVDSGWTEMEAIVFKDQMAIVAALERIRARLPFEFLGLDSDNGSEFINETLISYCQRHKVTFTRSRPYKKNDQCYVEQKNGNVVRRNVGYDRYEGLEACCELNHLYDSLRPYVNFWQPSMKLLWKHRVGAKVLKRYDKAKTPHDRVASYPQIPDGTKAELTALQLKLDPVSLLRTIHWHQDRLAKLAIDVTVATTATSNTANASMVSGAIIQTKGRHFKRAPKARTPHYWRTRADPFTDVWTEAELVLSAAPETTATALLEHLQRRYPGRFKQSQLRTLQRHVKQWRLSWIVEQGIGSHEL